LKLIKSAYFTEPADQSVWFYLHWLIDAKSAIGLLSEVERCTLIEAELANISELLAIEPEAPLALLAWCQLAMAASIRQAETKAHLDTLCRIDPQRLGYYSDLLQELPSSVTTR
jgi:geranylgeranyl transferase type-2 subunit alpha